MPLPPLSPAGPRARAHVLRIAHRGQVGLPGLTELTAYSAGNLKRIAAWGAHLLELDLRATRDDQLVVHHDATLIVGDREVSIAASDLHELTPHVPIAAEVLAAAQASGLGVYVDIKSITESAVRRLADLLASTGLSDQAVLAAAVTGIVSRCAELIPDLPRSVMFRPTDADPLQLAAQCQAQFVHPCWEDAAPRPDKLLAGQWLAQVRQRGLGVICWHEERPDVLDALLALGVDGICTDEPQLLTRLATRPHG